MTLTGHRHYASSSFSTNWAAPISGALNGYNGSGPGAQHTVYITDYAPNPIHDVHTVVTNNCYTDFGVPEECTLGALGITWVYDEAKHRCSDLGDCHAQHSRPNTWWYALVLLDNDAHSGFYGHLFSVKAPLHMNWGMLSDWHMKGMGCVGLPGCPGRLWTTLV